MVEEIGQFLIPSQRMDVRAVALAKVLTSDSDLC